MKIEIDFSNPNALKALEINLETTLNIVRKGLEKLSELPVPVNRPNFVKPTCDNLFSLFPDGEFSTTQALELGSQLSTSKIMIRRMLSELTASNKIQIVSESIGRRPAFYKKIEINK